MTKEGLIGINNRLPWGYLKHDMEFFKEQTSGNICIIGYKTWVGLPERYKDNKSRFNIIVSSRISSIQEDTIYGEVYIKTFDEALIIAEQRILKRKNENIFVIGGNSVYIPALKSSKLKRIYFTIVEHNIVHQHVNNEDLRVYFPVDYSYLIDNLWIVRYTKYQGYSINMAVVLEKHHSAIKTIL